MREYFIKTIVPSSTTFSKKKYSYRYKVILLQLLLQHKKMQVLQQNHFKALAVFKRGFTSVLMKYSRTTTLLN